MMAKVTKDSVLHEFRPSWEPATGNQKNLLARVSNLKLYHRDSTARLYDTQQGDRACVLHYYYGYCILVTRVRDSRVFPSFPNPASRKWWT